MAQNPDTDYVYFDEHNLEGRAIQFIFNNCFFDRCPMSGQILNYQYIALKDLCESQGLKITEYLPLFNQMLETYKKYRSLKN